MVVTCLIKSIIVHECWLVSVKLFQSPSWYANGINILYRKKDIGSYSMNIKLLMHPAELNHQWDYDMNGYLYHYIDVIMTTMASLVTSLTVVYSTVYSEADQRKHQSSASLAFVWGIHRDRGIPRTNGQLRGKCFHLMMSSWSHMKAWDVIIHVYLNNR